ncbi:acyl-CoA thioester hydrolase [Inhella inkyongensis]|uniref:Acyl-CoA thioester hydrolase n=1 Tax=Inhella inkyongensis TaxID=392593 RepID=A0A840S5V5_9BURK|nr:tol-pal system-associated acyl-CoA thioesterase [Inhella inkyongensis]MBB5204184.1 acyl-CoA thioester hydrolase [Inhella inkyongensis]
MNPEFRANYRAYYEDTDAGGVVYYANYLRFLERARSDWLRELGVNQETLRLSQGWVFVVAHVDARYLKPARLDDWLSVSARIAEQDRASLVFAQQIHRGADLLLDARIRVACVDAASFKPRRLPQEVLTRLTESHSLP